MKRTVTILAAAAVLLASASAFAANNYGWSLSGSPSAPCVSNGPAGQITTLALWYVYNTGDGMSAMEADLVLSPGITNFGFTPANGFLNAGNATNLLLAVGGCPSSRCSRVWTLFDAIVGLRRASAARVVDATCSIAGDPHGVTGFGTGANPACGVVFAGGDGCNPPVVSVESSTWGSLKALYR
jgi:hypothetical protein